MLISDLKIVHLAGGEGFERNALIEALSGQDVLIVQTCLRMFALGPEDAFSASELAGYGAMESQGVDAYSWMLATACGLYSQVIGETEIFSQIKDAWKCFDKSQSATAAALRPWMQKLYTDVKQIRNNHLQGIGGVSYGSLARKILNPEDGANVVLIGAGQLAEAVLPYFRRQQVFVWNRSEERLKTFRDTMTRQEFESSTCMVQLEAQMRTAHFVVLCTPVVNEFEIVLSDMPERSICVLHLGTTKPKLAHWSKRHDFSSLDQLFALQLEQNELKQMRIRRALQACEEKAHARYLMDAITINHGWEDLTGFS